MSNEKGQDQTEKGQSGDETTEKTAGEDTSEDSQTQSKDDKSKDDKDYKKMFKDQRVRAEKAEKQLAQFDKKKSDEKQVDDSLESKINLKVDLRMAGYSADEIKFAETYSKGLGKSLSSLVSYKDNKVAFNDEFITTAVDARRSKTRVAQKTSSPSPRSSASKVFTDLKSTKKEDRADKFSFEAWRNRQG